MSVLSRLGGWRKRGVRGGTKRRIPVLITNRISEAIMENTYVRQRNFNNLRTVSTSRIVTENQNGGKPSQFPIFMLTNPWSVGNKVDEISIFIQEHNIDVGLFSESWINEGKEHKISFDGYTLYSNGRTNRNGGGVLAVIRSDIIASKIEPIPEPDGVECLWIKLSPSKTPRDLSSLFICVVYHSPGQAVSTQTTLIRFLRESVDYIRTRSPSAGFLICGDFNEACSKVKQFCSSTGLRQVVRQATRDKSGKILDLLITNLAKYYEEPTMHAPFGLSDHNTVVWKPKPGFYRIKSHTETKMFQPLSESSFNCFGRWIVSQEWNEIIETDDLAKKLDVLDVKLSEAYERCFPLRKIKVNSNDKPWITPKIKQLCKQRQACFHQYGKTSRQFRTIRNNVIWEIKQSKRKYYKYQVGNLQRANPKQWYQKINQICGMNKKISSLKFSIRENDPSKLLEMVNDHLAEICQRIEPLQFDKLPAYLPSFSDAPQLSFWEVYYELQKIDCHKSVAPGDLPPKLIKEFAFELAHPLSDIFNTSLSQGKVPDKWKEATITPIPKEKGPISLNQIRPISITYIFARVLETFVASWITPTITAQLDEKQFGNRQGASTSHYLTSMIDYLQQGLDQRNHQATVIAIDYRKAFDLIDHTTAVKKLIDIGVQRELIPWISDFLNERKQRVKLNGELSNWHQITCGVPQGTKLGPLIFQVMVNDSIRTVEHRWKYVDDLSLCEVHHTNTPIKLQEHLTELSKWTKDNNMLINPDKSKRMNISFSKNNQPFQSLKIDNEEVKVVDSLKLLGVWVSCDLKWDKHIDDVVNRAGKKLYMLSCLKKFGMPYNHLKQIYISHIRPITEYACPVWHFGLTDAHTKELECIQKRACRIILGQQFVSYNQALGFLNLQQLNVRRESLLLGFAKGLDRILPDALTKTRGETCGRVLRNSDDRSEIFCRTKRFRNSCFPALCRLINENK